MIDDAAASDAQADFPTSLMIVREVHGQAVPYAQVRLPYCTAYLPLCQIYIKRKHFPSRPARYHICHAWTGEITSPVSKQARP